MAEFASVHDYRTFAHFVRRKARHVMDHPTQRFLETVLATSEKRVKIIKVGQTLWRAQLGHGWRTEWLRDENGDDVEPLFDEEAPLGSHRMTPLADRAYEGRVNPKGISCLYCSTERTTAMNEVRPWIGSYVSVGQFVTVRDLIVIDCTQDSTRSQSYRPYCQEPPPDKREENVWWSINRAFSEPVTRSDDTADYAPTQVLAEVFSSNGFEGLVYGSALGSGKTVAIFDLKAAKQSNCYLCQVKGVNLEYEESANPYFLE